MEKNRKQQHPQIVFLTVLVWQTDIKFNIYATSNRPDKTDKINRKDSVVFAILLCIKDALPQSTWQRKQDEMCFHVRIYFSRKGGLIYVSFPRIFAAASPRLDVILCRVMRIWYFWMLFILTYTSLYFLVVHESFYEIT